LENHTTGESFGAVPQTLTAKSQGKGTSTQRASHLTSSRLLFRHTNW
jgi:hypothetical protein